jgi:hypothetical protein
MIETQNSVLCCGHFPSYHYFERNDSCCIIISYCSIIPYKMNGYKPITCQALISYWFHIDLKFSSGAPIIQFWFPYRSILILPMSAVFISLLSALVHHILLLLVGIYVSWIGINFSYFDFYFIVPDSSFMLRGGRTRPDPTRETYPTHPNPNLTQLNF